MKIKNPWLRAGYMVSSPLWFPFYFVAIMAMGLVACVALGLMQAWERLS